MLLLPNAQSLTADTVHGMRTLKLTYRSDGTDSRHSSISSVSMLESFKIKLQRNSEDRNNDVKSNGDNLGRRDFTVTPEEVPMVSFKAFKSVTSLGL